MVDTIISCFHDSRGTLNLISSSLLTLTRGMYFSIHMNKYNGRLHVDPHPPPSDVHLAGINFTHLTFHWSPVSSNCDAIQYHPTVVTVQSSLTIHLSPVMDHSQMVSRVHLLYRQLTMFCDKVN